MKEFEAGLKREGVGGGGYRRYVGMESRTHFVSALIFRVVEVLSSFGLSMAERTVVVALRDFGSWESGRLGGCSTCAGCRLGSLWVELC